MSMVIPYTYYSSVGPNTHLTAAYWNSTLNNGTMLSGCTILGDWDGKSMPYWPGPKPALGGPNCTRTGMVAPGASTEWLEVGSSMDRERSQTLLPAHQLQAVVIFVSDTGWCRRSVRPRHLAPAALGLLQPLRRRRRRLCADLRRRPRPDAAGSFSRADRALHVAERDAGATVRRVDEGHQEHPPVPRRVLCAPLCTSWQHPSWS